MLNRDNEWLKDLNVGDEVCYSFSKLKNRQYEITTVAKITPTGKIRTADDLLFTDGVFTQKSNVAFRIYYYLEPLTNIVRIAVRRRELLLLIGKISFDQLSNAKLEDICKIAIETK